MNQRNIYGIALLLALAMFWTTGCSALKGTKTDTAKKAPKQSLYSQVPTPMRVPVDQAANDLRQAKADLKLADEQVKLAELKKERAILEKKRADQRQKLAKTTVQKQEVIQERKKVEAIDNANLGDKAKNIKQIANLKTKELNIESSCVKTRAAIATLDLEIQKLDRKVNLQASRVDSQQ